MNFIDLPFKTGIGPAFQRFSFEIIKKKKEI